MAPYNPPVNENLVKVMAKLIIDHHPEENICILIDADYPHYIAYMTAIVDLLKNNPAVGDPKSLIHRKYSNATFKQTGDLMIGERFHAVALLIIDDNPKLERYLESAVLPSMVGDKLYKYYVPKNEGI